jgi:hypothetical protein
MYFVVEVVAGLGLVAHIMFGFGPGSPLFQIVAVKPYLEHFGLYQAVRSSQRKILSCAYRMLVIQSGCGYISHLLDFLGDFHSCRFSKIVPGSSL